MTTSDRVRLANLLTDAAEIEHCAACQYLFLAFSMKRHPNEGGVNWRQLELMRQWEANITLIARQEMEHLGLVCNLLTAIGEAPHFARPNFPIQSDYFPVPDPPSLEPFGLRPLRRLIRFEKPAKLSAKHRRMLRASFSLGKMRPKKSVGQLYEEIKALFQKLNAIDPDTLFIGPASAQQTTIKILPIPGRGVPKPRQYDVEMDVVTDLVSALKVIDQIITEGEGSPQDRTGSHFDRLLNIAAALKAELRAHPLFRPARRVMENPKAVHTTNPATRAVFDVFENAYETIILLLLRYFAQTDESPSDILALQQATFFPMMTTVIRPLGEVLTQLPANAKWRAGPGFGFARRLAFLPHRSAAWQLIDMRLEAVADDLKGALQSQTYPPQIRERLSLVYQNASRIASDFKETIGRQL
jgi:hypothetical protein